MTEHHKPGQPVISIPSRVLPGGQNRSYFRFAALGDSATHGLGDPVAEGWRGWARLLADAVAEDHDVSFCNLAEPGATAADVRAGQLLPAVTHRPHLASLVVGLNDTMRSTWESTRVRDDLHRCADALTDAGARLLTVRFHQHDRVFRLPRVLARPLRHRIEFLNEVYDEIAETYGGFQVDLGNYPEVYERAFWSVDRLHPSELGHRLLAHEFGCLLNTSGLAFEVTDRTSVRPRTSRLQDVRWLVTEGAPWVGRRARDLGPQAVRTMFGEARARFA